MKSVVETMNPTRVKLTVEVPFDELKPSLDAAYKKIGQQINIPGFRKGKVPAPIIDQRVGRSYVIDEAVNDALPKVYAEALQENNITPLSQPEIDVTGYEDGGDLTFIAELDVKPQITLPEYHGIEAEVDDLSVTDEDVDGQLKILQQRFGTLTLVDRRAAEGDFVTINLSADKDGETIEDAQATGMSYQVGRGTMLEGLDEALIGMTADDSKTFTTKLVGGELKDQEVEVEVTVTEVKEQELPELDDEFAQTASEFDTIDELRQDVRDRLTRGARIEQASSARDRVLEKLLTMVEIPLPEAAVAEEIESRRNSITEQLQYADMTQAAYLESEGQTEEEFNTELEKRVRDAMGAQFLLDDIATAEQFGVDEQELSQHLMRRSQQSGSSPEEYIKHMMEHNHLPELVAEVRRGKALAHVVESAVIKDASGKVVELKTLLPDGTYADPNAAADSEGGPDEVEAEPVDLSSDVVTSSEYVTVEDDNR